MCTLNQPNAIKSVPRYNAPVAVMFRLILVSALFITDYYRDLLHLKPVNKM